MKLRLEHIGFGAVEKRENRITLPRFLRFYERVERMFAAASKDRESGHMTASIDGVVPPVALDDTHAVGGKNFPEFLPAKKHLGFSAAAIAQSDQVRHRCVFDPRVTTP